MLDILPFQFTIDKVAIAGSCLWSLALYLALASIREWIITQLNRWFNFAERFLYTSETEFEKTRPARESQNAFYASIMSILPFLIFGALSYWGVEISLGSSWGISTGILTTVGASIYELGRINGKNSD
ncbi:hypothetical protein [Cylindrospermopsis curvispora]|uniref:Uncharacterized protein n=1 Tax=Cylindrospermopsis curvispora GIHE-G1 TaxID=2666332 RepID=A0A7H0EWY4_9CYAN|nr:hypothetical protein [Cylindrospermopsis curvispora]QNP28300.1 hypothetical protein IAR63_10165 [Cylindrospermopsis curvispora GIHE-G1]BAZ90856.1 hypothetical protein NIES932_23620 [Raphidiopsis curvata NIES-932]